MVLDLVVWTFYHVVPEHLPDAIITEGVTARQRDRFFFVMVVRFKADTALEDGINFLD